MNSGRIRIVALAAILAACASARPHTFGDYNGLAPAVTPQKGERIPQHLTLQLNLSNLFDESYYTRVRGNNVATAPGRTSGWATPGDERSAQLTATWAF